MCRNVNLAIVENDVITKKKKKGTGVIFKTITRREGGREGLLLSHEVSVRVPPAPRLGIYTVRPSNVVKISIFTASC